jgi:hypothetical protein
MWQISALREAAIRELDRLLDAADAAEKLALADQFDVPQWSFPALRMLLRRKGPVTVADVEQIGLERALKIAALRDCSRYSESGDELLTRADSCQLCSTEYIVCRDSKHTVSANNWAPSIQVQVAKFPYVSDAELRVAFDLSLHT